MVKRDRWGNIIKEEEGENKETTVNVNVNNPEQPTSKVVEKKKVVVKEEDDISDDTPTPSTSS